MEKLRFPFLEIEHIEREKSHPRVGMYFGAVVYRL